MGEVWLVLWKSLLALLKLEEVIVDSRNCRVVLLLKTPPVEGWVALREDEAISKGWLVPKGEFSSSFLELNLELFKAKFIPVDGPFGPVTTKVLLNLDTGPKVLKWLNHSRYVLAKLSNLCSLE